MPEKHADAMFERHAQCARPIVAMLMAMTLLASGCGLEQQATTAATGASSVPPPSTGDVVHSRSDEAATSLRLLAAELNSARLAAQRVETLPVVRNALARREILLNVALYRAAYQSRVSPQLEYIVLEPVRDLFPPDVGIDPEEFRLRILGALDDLPTPVAWITETWRRGGIDFFPGTTERATRLRATIIRRDDDRGSVVAEISDWTTDLGASKQQVTCTWDGLAWTLERDPVRMVW
jgi:hypothetical protein